MHTQTGNSRTACDRTQGQEHSPAMDQIYLQSKEIQIPVQPKFKAYYIKVEGPGKLFFTLLPEPGGLCNQECKSHSTEGKQIKNCGHSLVGRARSQKGEDMNNLKIEGFY